MNEMTMQDMIKKIIEMDKTARQLTDEARARRAGSASAIERKKAEVSENFLSMARKRVDSIRNSEMRDAGEQQHQIEEGYAAVAQRLENTYMENRTAWVDAIVARIVEGDDLK